MRTVVGRSRCTGGDFLIYGAMARIAGSLAGLEFAKLHEPFPVWTGALAGLLSSILMGLLMITYRMPKE